LSQSVPKLKKGLAKRLSKIKASIPANAKRYSSNQILNPAIINQNETKIETPKPHTVSQSEIIDNRNQRTPFAPTLVNQSRFSDVVAFTAQQYADEAAKAHASKAGWLVDRVIGDMTAVLDRVSESIPFADVREIKPLTETHQIASAEIRRALGLRDDIDASGSRSLVQIQCVGTVSVTEPVQPMSIDLPDVDFE
jgi:hypothetical protein